MIVPEKYFYDLSNLMTQEPDQGLQHCRLEGAILRLDQWDNPSGSVGRVAVDDALEAFVLVLDGEVTVVDTALDTEMGAREGEVCALLDAAQGRYQLEIGGRCVVASMPTVSEAELQGTPPAPPTKFAFEDVLEEKYDGWRFYAQDGGYMTVGCSYRTSPPPSKETPHTHAGEQFNVAVEGLFEMTIGGVVHQIHRGWVSHIPPETLHTGEHKKFPYFQVIFSTPPRGSDYDKFLAGIYKAQINT